MKTKKSLLVLILLCIFVPSIANASYYCQIKSGKSEIRIRKSISSTSVYTFANAGATFDMPDNEKLAGTSACSDGWYKVNYEGNIGYICASFVDVYEKKETIFIDNKEARNACEQELKEKGFPSSYWNDLCTLKQKYPNWEFNAVNTGLNFVDVVSGESKCGKNTINSGAKDSYKDNSCTGALDSGSSHASAEAIAYYLNPLNFLNETSIFMFEDQNTNSNIDQDKYMSAAQSTFSSKLLKDISYLPTMVKVAAIDSGLSQTAISSRFKQELGTGYGSGGGMYCIIAGNYTTKYGWYYSSSASPTWDKSSSQGRVNLNNYFNWFNIGANDGSDVTKRSFAYAVNHGWGGSGDIVKDRQTAMTGGATWIMNNYVKIGQNTAYFNKWNTHPNTTSSLYVHQYMSNVKAPQSESSILYTAYKNANILDSKFRFYIPVYTNLGGGIDNTPSGATGEDIENKDGNLLPSTVAVASGFKVSGSNVTGINPGTSMNDIKNKVAAMGGTVTGDLEGNAGTGKKFTITTAAGKQEYTIIIKGDPSGDGIINALDLLQVQKSILNQYNMSNEQKLAADPSGDGVVNALDLLQVQKSILGQYTISQ